MEYLLDTLKWGLIVGAAALALTLLKPLLDKRYSPRWRYGAWLAMAALLLLAPVQWERLAVESAPPAVVIEVPRMELAVSREEGVRLQRPAGTLPAAPGTAYAPENKPERVLPLDKALPVLWLGGAAAFLLYHLLGTFLFQRRARRWSSAPGEETARVYGEVRREMGLQKAPPLRVSRRVSSPMLTGLFRPCLLLPEEALEEQELRFVLRHELTHWRRRDLWYKLAVLAANALHWFNPLVYLMGREAARDMELTCDALVVAGADAQARRAYSETLLASVHRQKGLDRWALTTHFYGGAEVMKERFRNILGKQGRKWGGIALALTLLVTVVTACAVGVSQASGPEELSREELDAWQEKLSGDPDMRSYLWRMYTDPAYVPPEELVESFLEPGTDYLGIPDPEFTIVSGTADGETVTLELEGSFSSGLARGTLTLADGRPVSLTNPLYTAVEKIAWDFVNASSMAGTGVEIADRCVPNIYCSDSFELDGKVWYVWEMSYWLKPADISQVTLAGGMDERGGWVSDFYSAPIFIVSEDRTGNVVLEETAAQYTKEEGYTWQDYIYGRLMLGMEDMDMVLNGWPEMDSSFLEGLRNGHETWSTDWEDVANSYAGLVAGASEPSDSGFSVLYRAQSEKPDYSESVAAKAVYGDRALFLLLTHVVCSGDLSFWQVTGSRWDPDAPAAEPSGGEVLDDPLGYMREAGELTSEEMEAFAAYFNYHPDTADSAARNGLLRFPYESLDDVRHYFEILFYDAGEPVTEEAERAALEERMGAPIETDCTKLSRDYIREFLTWYFVESIPEEEMDRILGEEISLPNLPDHDAFYLVHGDTMMTSYTFDRGVREADGTVKLYYTTDLFVWKDGELDVLFDQPMCAAMRLTGNDVWGMVSNTATE